jgi:hypothetical protein
MSLASNASKQYGIAAAMSDVPLSLGSSTLSKPLPSETKIVSVPTQSANAGPGGNQIFQLPTGSGTGFIKPNSMYFAFDIAATNAGGGGTWNFQGPTRSASSLINRLTVQIGSTNVEQINNYNILHDQLLLHTANASYFANDSNLIEGTSSVATVGPATGVTASYSIPLISSLFSNEKCVPTFLLQGPITILLDYNSLLNTIQDGTVAFTATNYTVSNARIVYETIAVDESYKQGVKAMLAEGRLFQMNLVSYMNLQVALQDNVNYTIGANLSSIKGLLYSASAGSGINASVAVAAGSFASGRPLYNVVSNASTCQNNFRLYLDGRLINQLQNLNSKNVVFSEMNRTVSNMFDTNSTSVDPINYLNATFVGGINTNRFNERMAMCGSPAQNLNFIYEATGTGGTGNLYVNIIYDQVLVCDALGSVSMVR